LRTTLDLPDDVARVLSEGFPIVRRLRADETLDQSLIDLALDEVP